MTDLVKLSRRTENANQSYNLCFKCGPLFFYDYNSIQFNDVKVIVVGMELFARFRNYVLFAECY
jgi:hypothetical protein